MPSFLSKVFGRKKQDDNKELAPPDRTSAASLLDGRFEAVSPTVSEAPQTPVDVVPGKEKEKEKEAGGGGFSLLNRSKSSSGRDASKPRTTPAPHLTLNLSEPKQDTQTLAIPFGSSPHVQLSDEAIGARRLSPAESLSLIKACTHAIVARGLETPGLMHPHWYSADPLAQRRLISLFLHSISPEGATTPFDEEIASTRSSHDVAAVFRWAIRHLKLDGASFGLKDDWYQAFFDAEKSNGYPSTAFKQFLLPQLPSPHADLLIANLDLFSSLAAHAEANAISGSKIAKILGLWLLEAHRAEGTETWSTFYQRWESAGRQLEHLFLASIRQESGLPRRLTDLVKAYPYSTASTDTLLARPRFSTRQYLAIYVHIDTELPSISASIPDSSYLRLLTDALNAGNEAPQDNENATQWTRIKDAAANGEGTLLGRVFDDETVRFLSLVISEGRTLTPLLALNGQVESAAPATTSPPASPSAAANAFIPMPEPLSSTQSSGNGIGIDWSQFSTSGFLESVPLPANLAGTLMDNDIEKTLPRANSKKRAGKIPDLAINTKAATTPAATAAAIVDAATEETKNEPTLISSVTALERVEIDEAFVDFWHDALVDPVKEGWPNFVVGKLRKNIVQDGVEWVVIEQGYTRPAPPAVTATTTAETSETGETGRTVSPRPSLRASISGKKRFSFWERSPTTNKKRTTSKSSDMGEIGEMGEQQPRKSFGDAKKIISEARKSFGDKRKSVNESPKNGLQDLKENDEEAVDPASVAAVGGVAAAAAGAAVALAATSNDDEPSVTAKDAFAPSADAPVVVDASPEATTQPEADATVPAPAEPAPVDELRIESTTPAAIPPEAPTAVDSTPTVEVDAPVHSEPEPIGSAAATEVPVEETIPDAAPVVLQAAPVEEPSVVEEATSPVLEEEPVSAVVEESIPATEEKPTPAEEQEVPVVGEELPAVDEVLVPSTETESTPAEEPAPTVEESTPVVEETSAPVVEEVSAPVIEDVSAPVVEEPAQDIPEGPVHEDISAPIVDVIPAVSEPAVDDAPTVVEEVAAPIAQDIPFVVEGVAPAEETATVEEPTSVEESTPVEEPTPIEEPTHVEEPAHVEEPTPIEPTPIEDLTSVQETLPVDEVIVPTPKDHIADEPAPEETESAQASPTTPVVLEESPSIVEAPVIPLVEDDAIEVPVEEQAPAAEQPSIVEAELPQAVTEEEPSEEPTETVISEEPEETTLAAEDTPDSTAAVRVEDAAQAIVEDITVSQIEADEPQDVQPTTTTTIQDDVPLPPVAEDNVLPEILDKAEPEESANVAEDVPVETTAPVVEEVVDAPEPVETESTVEAVALSEEAPPTLQAPTEPLSASDVSEPRIEPLREPTPDPQVDIEPIPVVDAEPVSDGAPTTREEELEVKEEPLPRAPSPIAPSGLLTRGPEATLSAAEEQPSAKPNTELVREPSPEPEIDLETVPVVEAAPVSQDTTTVAVEDEEPPVEEEPLPRAPSPIAPTGTTSSPEAALSITEEAAEPHTEPLSEPTPERSVSPEPVPAVDTQTAAKEEENDEAPATPEPIALAGLTSGLESKLDAAEDADIVTGLKPAADVEKEIIESAVPVTKPVEEDDVPSKGVVVESD